MAELTPAEKRKITMEQRYGENWRQRNGQLAKDARIDKVGEGKYRNQLADAGKKGGNKTEPADRPFTKNRKLAKRAGKKRAAMRAAEKRAE